MQQPYDSIATILSVVSSSLKDGTIPVSSPLMGEDKGGGVIYSHVILAAEPKASSRVLKLAEIPCSLLKGHSSWGAWLSLSTNPNLRSLG